METLLEGNRIVLRPLQYSDADALVHAAADGELWNLAVTIVPSSSTVDSYLKKALDGRDAGSVLPFVIVLKDTGKVIGSTRLWKVDRLNRKLEIGSSWTQAQLGAVQHH